ncbi:M23 family metallopeptidase [Gordonia soli]|uniref:Peptidase M23 family protein n=1 Tax=Gordonia soli NBRC 108243 TaxID=1223545 RepID=M0QIT4_9ACTN|nr:M23 family metallopeptidase [Gordonia soli]GAC68211.1 peptidase M23 family protein [Gordonia soli NBRC 108243]
MGDLAGRGLASGPAAPTRRATRTDDAMRAEEMTTVIAVDDYIPSWEAEADAGWESDTRWGSGNWDSDRRDSYYHPTRSEITQDILIPEDEFDEYVDEPYEVQGAELDSFFEDYPENATSSGELQIRVADSKPFRTQRATSGSRRGGKHRVTAPPTALKGGRAALVAMAAGAAVAAVAQVSTSAEPEVTPTTAANVGDAALPAADLGPGIAPDTSARDMSTFTQQLAVGKRIAAAEAQREALARRPLFASPIPMGKYDFTSSFAMRWGSFHGGIDMAAPLGTPIHSATDGVVIAAGPASGYGNWVQVRAADGTVTMYGHMASSGVLVQKGQHVTAGDVIALVGSEGFSTGPHCHFEVWKNGTTKIDPMPWLAQHGVQLSAYTGG